MDELYPGKGRGDGFQVNGFAEAFGTPRSAFRPKDNNGR